MKQMKKGKSGGFSMIELLVVIAVIGILAGLLLPVLGQMKGKAKFMATMATLKNIEVALRQYDFVFGQYPPDASMTTDYDLAAECLVYYLGTPFRRLPDAAKGEVQATKNGGPFFEFKDEFLRDIDGDSSEEIVDYWENPFEYDNLRDDDTPADDTHTDAGPDPRGGTGKNQQSYDLWSGGEQMGAVPNKVVANFKP